MVVNLIILEWKKNDIKKDIFSAVVMTGVLLAILFSTISGINTSNMAELNYTSIISVSIELFTQMSYIVFTSIMLSSYIVFGYKNQTMGLMFTYPVKRQKIILAQMLSVWIFNVIALILTKLLAYGMFVMTGYMIHLDMTGVGYKTISFYFQIVISSVIIISICFMTLLAGIELKSSRAVIVASIILVSLIHRNLGIYMLADNLVFYLILFILSIVSIFFSIHKIENSDI